MGRRVVGGGEWRNTHNTYYGTTLTFRNEQSISYVRNTAQITPYFRESPRKMLKMGYAPGGLAEMSLIALSLGIETAFVATHHVIRIGLIVVVAPLVFTRIRRPGGQA